MAFSEHVNSAIMYISGFNESGLREGSNVFIMFSFFSQSTHQANPRGVYLNMYDILIASTGLVYI